MKLTTFFFQELSRFTQKILTVSESTFKINTTSPLALFKILLTSAVICKQRFFTKTRLCNILKTTNSKTLIKATFNPYKFLQTP